MAFIISVAQQKGGSGKTTLAMHLAVGFAQKGMTTSLVDVYPQGTASTWHEMRGLDDVALIRSSGWRLDKDLDRPRAVDGVVVIDCPPHGELDARSSIRAADLVLIPMQPTPADLWATQTTLELVEEFKGSALVVPNRAVARAGSTTAMINKLIETGAPVSDTRISNRVVFVNTMFDGQTVLDVSPNRSENEINALIDEVSHHIGIDMPLEKTA